MGFACRGTVERCRDPTHAAVGEKKKISKSTPVNCDQGWLGKVGGTHRKSLLLLHKVLGEVFIRPVWVKMAASDESGGFLFNFGLGYLRLFHTSC